MKIELLATTTGALNTPQEHIDLVDPEPVYPSFSFGRNANPATLRQNAAMKTLFVLFLFLSYDAYSASRPWVPLNANKTELERSSDLNYLRAENEMLRHQLGHPVPAEVRIVPSPVTVHYTTVYSPPPHRPVVVEKTIVVTNYPSPPPLLIQVRPACPYRSGQWISGSWVSTGNRYVWSSGYWVESTPQPIIVRYYAPIPPRHPSSHERRDSHHRRGGDSRRHH